MQDHWRTADASELAALAMERNLVLDIDHTTIPGLVVVAAPHFTHTVEKRDLSVFLLGMLAASSSPPPESPPPPESGADATNAQWRHGQYQITLALTRVIDREDRTAEFIVYDKTGAQCGRVRYHYLNFRDDPDQDRDRVATALADLMRRLDQGIPFEWPVEDVQLVRYDT